MNSTTGNSINYTINEFVQQGWQCPLCKRILAPFITECPCRGEGRQTYTSATTFIKGEKIDE